MSDLWDGWSPSLARTYVAHRVGAPFDIDGRLDKAPWRDLPWTEDFVDIEGDAKPHPRFRTRAKMCWDEQHFYIAAEMEEPHVWATLTERDSVIFHDNDFEVFIDPDGDHCDYYELEINALNTVWDLRLPRPYRDGGTAINEWDIAGLRTAVHIDGTLNDASDVDRGWSVEIAIPWKALAEFSRSPAPPRDGDQWRINFSRVQWQTRVLANAGAGQAPNRPSVHDPQTQRLSRPAGEVPSEAERAPAPSNYEKLPGVREDNWVWSPQGVIDMHRPERWGYVQFTTAPPGAAVTFKPDPLAAAKWWLQRIHEAQRAHRERTGRYARHLEDLPVLPLPAARVASFDASAEHYAITIDFAGRRMTKDATGRVTWS